MQSTNYRLDKEVDSVYILLDDRLSLESENHRLNNVPELSVVLNKCNSNDDCLYLEKPTLCEENNLKFLRQIVSKLQTEINDAVETTRNNFWPLNRGKKRKLEECVDFRNNNDIGYTTTGKFCIFTVKFDLYAFQFLRLIQGSLTHSISNLFELNNLI